MAISALHQLNMHWLIGDPSEMRELGPTIYQLYAEAIGREVSQQGKQAVIVGAIGGPGRPCVFDTEVITPKHDSPELRPTYHTIFRVCDAIKDLIADGPPESEQAANAIFERARQFLNAQKRDVRAAQLLAESAVMVIYGERMPEHTLAITYYPDGRLLVLPVLLLRELVLAYLEAKSPRAA